MQVKLDEVKETEKAVLQNLLTENSNTVKKLENSISQVGKAREDSSSEISKLVSDSKTEIQELVSSIRLQLRNLLLWTAAASILLSVLVCMAWQHWVI